MSFVADTEYMEKTPQLVAHRGYAAAYPENTLPAFQAAIDLGVRWLECDVQLTADAVPVVAHDKNLQRVAGESLDVLSSTSEDVLSYCVGESSRFGERFSDVFPPTCEQLFKLLSKYPDVYLFLDFKAESLDRFGVEEVFNKVWSTVGDLTDRVIPISCSEKLVRYAKQQGVKAVGWVALVWDEKQKAIAESLQPDYLFINWTRLPNEAPLWQGPWQWAVYEVIDPVVAERLVARGILFIESMDPEALIHHLPFSIQGQ